MKKLTLLCISLCMLSLTACSKMPKECNEAWDKLEKFGKQMGVPEEQLKVQKEQFEKDVKALKTEVAVEQCSAQNSLMGMVGQ